VSDILLNEMKKMVQELDLVSALDDLEREATGSKATLLSLKFIDESRLENETGNNHFQESDKENDYKKAS
jgi:hypothetical protein